MSDRLLASTFLFRFSIPCHHFSHQWSNKGLELEESHRLPSFGELEERPQFADTRLGWNERGLAVSVRVSGKKQSAL